VLVKSMDRAAATAKKPADKVVMDRLDQQPRTSIRADGRRKRARMRAFGQLIGDVLARRIAPFDAAAAQETAALIGLHRSAHFFLK
jgi:hypothetical protein